MIARVALAGIACAACLSPPDEAGHAVADGAPATMDAHVESDAGPCTVQFRDDFDGDTLGDSWIFYGDSDDTSRDVGGGALTVSATAKSSYSFGSVHTDVAWDLAETTIEAHVDPQPSDEGDVFFGWIEEDGDRYLGLAAIWGQRVSIVDGVLGATWVEPCDPECPDFVAGVQRWRIRPEGSTLVFEISPAEGGWQVFDAQPMPAFARGRPGFWAETAIGYTSTLTIEVVTVAGCD
jgi:hypothetical protein